jgi:DHA1 family multidrug resistance protein-like MFS transporter
VSYSSAVFTTAVNAVSREFNVDTEVVTLGTTLFVLGFAFGPIIWAPASELRGRKWPLTISMLMGGIFTIGSAVSKSISPLLVCRFFAGVCGAGQLALVPSVLADVYDDTTRGVAISLYALTVFAGPFIAPFTGGFIVTGTLGWRWTLYFPAILSLVNGLISLVFLRETHAPRLLVKKAVSIRLHTHNNRARAPLETLEIDTKELLQKYFSRPLYMLFTEPVILLVSIYMSFVYGLVYCLLGAYPLVFQGTYNMGQGVGGLPFLGLAIGQLFACTFIIWVHSRYTKDVKNNKSPVIEQRLFPALLGAPVFSIGIFW